MTAKISDNDLGKLVSEFKINRGIVLENVGSRIMDFVRERAVGIYGIDCTQVEKYMSNKYGIDKETTFETLNYLTYEKNTLRFERNWGYFERKDSKKIA
jgi:hypothetical protein